MSFIIYINFKIVLIQFQISFGYCFPDSCKAIESRFNERSLESPGKLTTWSNLGKNTPPNSTTTSYQHTPPTPVLWQSRNREELNNNGEIRKSKSLPEPEAQDLVNTFMRGRGGCEIKNNDEIPMMRSKDSVNQYLKTNSRLTSIEEQAEGGTSISSFLEFIFYDNIY